MKYKTIKLKRLFNGIASVRDYEWASCIKNGYGIEFLCNGSSLKIDHKDLVKGEISHQIFSSKFRGKNESYRLVDFKWKS